MDDAACAEVGTEFFFPEKGEPSIDAKRICAGCPVVEECLVFGMGEVFGIWGGTTAKQRVPMRRSVA